LFPVRSDNGPPFASCAVAGLSRLSVWWIKLGIVPERIEISGLYRLRKNSRLSG
jgi:hypothetical protein